MSEEMAEGTQPDRRLVWKSLDLREDNNENSEVVNTYGHWTVPALTLKLSKAALTPPMPAGSLVPNSMLMWVGPTGEEREPTRTHFFPF